MKEYVCIDIGGTAIKAGVLDENARIIEWQCSSAKG